jgi:polysaccharide deacetylase family protein (PEP-CTERM system associated)
MHTRAQRGHILTVGLEDFFQVDAFERLIEPRLWPQFERRLERNLARTLDLLDAAATRATFFVLGWTADAAPELIRSIAERGHEIASRGYEHRSVRQLDPGSLADDLARAREAIERAAGVRVHGHRAARLWYARSELWALDILARQGYAYDSSLAPFLRRFASEPWRRRAHQSPSSHGPIWELPVSTTTLLGLTMPIAGGNYARQLPARFVERGIARWMRTEPAPFVMYFHTWELDPDQPRVAAPLLQRIRQYRNLDRTQEFLASWLRRASFGTAAGWLGIEPDCPPKGPPPMPLPATVAPVRSRPEAQGLTVVVPCRNQAAALPEWRELLEQVPRSLGTGMPVHWVFVDDGSTDATWGELARWFGGRNEVRLVRHPAHHGIAAAIRTGILRSRTERVCSLAANDARYVAELGAMVRLLGPGTALVTAEGAGRSRSGGWLERAYGLALGSPVGGLGSTLRVYRRSDVIECQADLGNEAGLAELMARLRLAGRRVVMHPVPGGPEARSLRHLPAHALVLAMIWWVRGSRALRAALRRVSGFPLDPSRPSLDGPAIAAPMQD